MTSVEDKFRQARAAVLEAPWVTVLPEADLRREIGVPALVGGQAVAVFRTHADELFAVSNYDPASGASVMARGIVGTRGDVPVVASPMYKHVFDLRTGRCLDDDTKALRPYEVRVADGFVQVRERQLTQNQINGVPLAGPVTQGVEPEGVADDGHR